MTKIDKRLQVALDKLDDKGYEYRIHKNGGFIINEPHKSIVTGKFYKMTIFSTTENVSKGFGESTIQAIVNIANG